VSDALLAGDKPSKNHGASGSLAVGSVPPGERQALLRFDVGAIPPGAIVTSATLTMSTLLGGGASVHVHRATAAWDESTVTWGSFGGAQGAHVEADLPGVPSVVSTNVKTLVQGWASGIYPNDGVLLERALTGSTIYASSEDPVVSRRPKLDVCYVPPTGASLWSRPWPAPIAQIAADEAGNVLVTGTTSDPVDFGDGPLPGSSVYLAKLDPSGNALWSRAILGAPAIPMTIGADGAGNVALVGHYLLAPTDPVDFGGGPLSLFGELVFVARYDAQGNFSSFSWRHLAQACDFVSDATVARSGHVFITGGGASDCSALVYNPLKGNAGTLFIIDFPPAGSASAYAYASNASVDSVHENEQFGEAIAVDPSGAPVIAAESCGALPPFGPGASGLFIGRPGGPSWSVAPTSMLCGQGVSSPNVHEDLVMDGFGNPTLAFGSNPYFDPQGPATFVKFDPVGNTLWSLTTPQPTWSSLASDAAGNTFVSYPGGGLTKVDHGGNALWSKSSTAALLAADGAGNVIAVPSLLLAGQSEVLVKYAP
jgi:hypothetical protein